MNETVRGFRTSVLIHGAFLLLVMVLNITAGRERHIIAIDMGLVRSPGEGNSVPAARKAAPRPAVQPEELSPAAAPSPDRPEPALQEPPVPNPGVASTEADARSTSAGGGASDAEGLKNAYLNEYFAYIRDRIVKNLSFPPAARKKGWSGKITVCFVVCTDGHVESIRIIESTGFEVLDRNVVETIKRSAPFPRAPVEAELTIPIVYKLL